MTRVVILGGGPGGYEAALVAAQLGAEVIVVDRDGLGGSAVLTDCVPSKTLVATAEVMTARRRERRAGRTARGEDPDVAGGRSGVDLAEVNARVKRLALAQSARHPRPGSRARACALVEGAGRLVEAVRRRGAATSGSRPTRCSSPPAPARASCPAPSRTASASSPGPRSTTSPSARSS